MKKRRSRMTKIVVVISAFIMILSSGCITFAGEYSANLSIGCTQKSVETIKTKQIDLIADKEEEVIITNEGKPIESDILDETAKKAGNKVFGVFASKKGDVNYQLYIISNDEEMKISDIVEKINKYSKNENELKASSTNSYYRDYNWNLRYSNKVDYVTITTTVHLSRKSSNANINGSTGSVWDIISSTQTEATDTYIREHYTRLSANQPNQKLVDWGPEGSNQTGSVSVSLNSMGVAAASYSFNIGNFTVTDLSSKSEKYGRWKFDTSKQKRTLKTKPGIRVTNTKGDLYIDVSHSIYQYIPNAWGQKLYTGEVRIIVPDR